MENKEAYSKIRQEQFFLNYLYLRNRQNQRSNLKKHRIHKKYFP